MSANQNVRIEDNPQLAGLIAGASGAQRVIDDRFFVFLAYGLPLSIHPGEIQIELLQSCLSLLLGQS